MNFFGYLYTIFRNSIETIRRLKTLQDTCDEILGLLKPGEASAVIFYVDGERKTKVDISITQQFSVSVAFVDKKGNPAPVDGTPQWSTDNTDVLKVTAAPDGMSATVAAVGAIGSASITLSADADLGAGVVPLVGTLAVNVTAGQAASVVLTPGPVTEQPDVPIDPNVP